MADCLVVYQSVDLLTVGNLREIDQLFLSVSDYLNPKEPLEIVSASNSVSLFELNYSFLSLLGLILVIG